MKANSTTEIAKRIRKYRRMRNLSQRELAELVKVDSCTISLYERGKFKPSADVIVELSKALEINIDALLMDELTKEAQETIEEKELMHFLKLVEKFPKKDKEMVKNLLHAIAIKNGVV